MGVWGREGGGEGGGGGARSDFFPHGQKRRNGDPDKRARPARRTQLVYFFFLGGCGAGVRVFSSFSGGTQVSEWDRGMEEEAPSSVSFLFSLGLQEETGGESKEEKSLFFLFLFFIIEKRRRFFDRLRRRRSL